MALLESLARLLFAPVCPACDATTATPGLCPGCAASLYPIGAACPRCALPIDGATPVVCRACAKRPLALAGITAPLRYGGELAAALRRLKRERRPDLCRGLVPHYRAALGAAAADADLVVPVPLHWRRLAARGFNQALLLAQLGLPRRAPIDPLALTRVRATPPQRGLGAAARRRNLVGAFAVPRGRVAAIAGRRVLLVDDVITTGATLDAAAHALLAAGAARVTGFAIARADPPGR